ncbi:MAG: protoporphyrinogen oxidase [Myxococcales bacterium]|nr:protoporphyrinogen oxidase [Myxococcales bacterium]
MTSSVRPPPSVATRSIAIIGAGIAGLTSAYRASKRWPAARVTVFEASDRAGGPIGTSMSQGFLLERGPDGFVRSKGSAEALARELGLGSELIETRPEYRKLYILKDGALVAAPEGLSLVVPSDVGAWVRSPLASPRGKLRALYDLVLPRRDLPGEETIASFVRRRLGDEVCALFAESVLAGIHSGDPDRLSIQATFPQLVAMEREHRSLIVAARELRSKRTSAAPVSAFLSLARGMGSLIDALVAALPPDTVRLRTPVRALSIAGRRWVVHSERGAETFDALHLAIPPRSAAPLLAPIAPEASRLLAAIRHVSSAVVLLGYHERQLARSLDASGFVVPPNEACELTASTWLSHKWPGRAPEGHVLLRGFLGGTRDPSAHKLSDEALVNRARAGFAQTLGADGEPVLSRVVRYADASPQMELGHRARIERARQLLREVPAEVHLGSAGVDGVGIPDTIRQASAVWT